MSDHRELFNLIGEAYGDAFKAFPTIRAVESVLAAGYRKPRTITTAEELDALPVNSVVRPTVGFPYSRTYSRYGGGWVATGFVGFAGPIALPVAVLWEPQS